MQLIECYAKTQMFKNKDEMLCYPPCLKIYLPYQPMKLTKRGIHLGLSPWEIITPSKKAHETLSK